MTTAPEADRGGTAPTRVRYQVLAAACSLAVLTYVQRQGFVAGTPYIKKNLGLDDPQMGSLASVWLGAHRLFPVPPGPLRAPAGGRPPPPPPPPCPSPPPPPPAP